MKKETVVLKVSELILDDRNPRTITKSKRERLKKSLLEFPEMMELRSVIIDEKNMVLAGNQRVTVLMELDPDKEIEVTKVTGLSESKKKEFKIKDNAHYGEWDLSVLFEDYSQDDIFEAGLDLSIPDEIFEEFDDDVITDEECKMPITPKFDEKHEGYR